jgi:hypothetical protein
VVVAESQAAFGGMAYAGDLTASTPSEPSPHIEKTSPIEALSLATKASDIAFVKSIVAQIETLTRTQAGNVFRFRSLLVK